MADVSNPDTTVWPVIGSLLVHRLRRAPNIKPVLIQRHVFAVLGSSQQTRDVDPVPGLGQCRPIVCDAGPTLSQCWFNFSCLLGWLTKLFIVTFSTNAAR